MSIQLPSINRQIAEAIIGPGVSFGVGALYATVTNGPVLLTASVNAISTIALCAIQTLLVILAKNDVISAKTYNLLKWSGTTLVNAALLVTAVSLGLIGPVAITVISIGVVSSAIFFVATILTPENQLQFQHA